MSFTVYPAIDVRDARVVRLAQGDYGRESRYATDPLAQAAIYAAGGARWLHLVDLDAARDGEYALAPLLRAIRAGTALQVQTGGGVRGEADVVDILGAGASRVVVGSLAVREPERVAGWIARFGVERIVVALDVRRGVDGAWTPGVHGWTEAAEESLETLVALYARAGLRHLLCTDIDRDGMFAGPNLPLYAWLRGLAPAACIQASGGARDAADVAAARRVGCAGIVLGKTLLDGRLGLGEALASSVAPTVGRDAGFGWRPC